MTKPALVCAAAVLFIVTACAPAPAELIPAPAPPAPSESTPENAGSETVLSACGNWDPSQRDWFELEAATSAVASAGVEGFVLPASSSTRYNTVMEVCPSLWWVLTHDGESRFLDLGAGVWSQGPSLSPSGITESSADAGVQSGGPTWGFRDSALAGNQVFLSDGVLDASQQCVRIDVHALSLADLLTPTPDRINTEVIYQSSPCVSFTDPWRADSPLRTHLGAALAYSPQADALFLTIGDFHLAASSLSQAEAIGLANTEKDYALLSDPNAAIGALIEIPLDESEARVVAKGLRNSLGVATDREGAVWISDHGPRGGDELNLFAPGANYGWPLTTMGEPYDRSSFPDDPNQLLAPWLDNGSTVIPGTTNPVLWWTPAIAPTQLVPLGGTSTTPPLLAIGGLASEAIIIVALDGDETQEISRVRLGERVRNVAGDSTGSFLVTITDSATLWVVSTATFRGL